MMSDIEAIALIDPDQPYQRVALVGSGLMRAVVSCRAVPSLVQRFLRRTFRLMSSTEKESGTKSPSHSLTSW